MTPIDMFRAEPALVITAITGLVDAVLLLLVTFGVPISGSEKASVDAVLAAVMTVLSVFAGVLIRTQVMPTPKS